VVNDLGGSTEGVGASDAPALAVAEEIVAAGGTARADTHDVATVDGAQALVDGAVEAHGRLDIVVNNAGIIRWAGLPDVDADNLAQHLAVHLGGTFNTVRAAWPHLLERGYGRIVNTTSTGMFGLPNNISYAAAKAGVVGLTRAIAVAGRKRNIRANLIAPAAHTRMAAAPGDEGEIDDGPAGMAPDLVAPMVAFLAHEDCPVNGEVYAAGGGRFARIFLASTPGYVDPSLATTPEDVAEHWDEINDESGYSVPADLMSWSAAFLAHQEPAR
jgi:NAD(P)-dependent dehydrogenase (short-subunit alcohol dehydrogenase family)